MRKLKGHRLYLLAVLTIYANVFFLATTLTTARTNLQNVIFDQYQRWHPRLRSDDPLVRIVDIDDESVRRLGQWPWPRQAVARLVETLADAGAAAICLDVLFSEADRAASMKLGRAAEPVVSDSALDPTLETTSAGDAALARAMADRPVVLAELMISSDLGVVRAKSGFTFIGEDPTQSLPRLSGVLAPVNVLAEKAAGIGFVNWQPDADRVVRRVPLVMTAKGRLQPSFAIESLRVAQGASTYILKSAGAVNDATFGSSSGVVAIKVGDVVVRTQPGGDIRAYFAASDPRLSTPAWRVFDNSADLSGFAGKIAVVGVSAAMLSDVVATPLDPSTPGIEAQAQLIEQLLGGVSLLRPDWALGAELFAGTLISLILVVALPRISPLAGALVGALAVGVMAIVSWLGFVKYGLLLDPVTPSLSSGAVFLAGALALYGQKKQQLTEVRTLFGRFVSSTVVERLAERPEAIELGGVQRRLTVMFCDLRSFTTLAEKFSAVELTSFLNEYLTPMTDIVLLRMGTIDKYMGDAIMAFWNAPLDDKAHAENAVRAALEMRVALAKLNRGWAARTLASGAAIGDLKFGIGLNTGECCVGNLGSTRRLDYSAIGDEVNVASRLEGASKVFAIDIIASASTRAEAPGFAWLEIERVVLKNKTRPTAVYALAGDAEYAGSEKFKLLAERHDQALAAYRGRDFAAAASAAAAAESLAPDTLKNLYTIYYKERFARLTAAGDEAGWEPVLTLDSK